MYQVVSWRCSLAVTSGNRDLVAFDQRQVGKALLLALVAAAGSPIVGMKGPHVVRVGQAEVLVEAVPRGQELRMVAQMPLAEDRRGIAALLDQFGQRHFVVADADFRPAGQARLECRRDWDSSRSISAVRDAEQTACADVESGEANALGGHAIEVRRGVTFGAENAHIAIAQVVAKDDDDIRPRRCVGRAADAAAPSERANERPGSVPET